MYPPLDVPKPAAPDVWVVDSGPQHLLGLHIPVRMTVVRLTDGGLWLHSPTRHAPALGETLAALGPVRHLVSPSTAHWVHLPAWQDAYPDAKLWAPPGVADRARGQGVVLRAAGVLGAAPPPDWEGQFDQAVLRGRAFHEVAFHHRASRSLILCDTVQAMEPSELPWREALLTRLLGAAGPVGGTPRHVRLILKPHRDANRAAFEQLLALAPERVIFAHGAWFTQDGTARLRRALRWLL